MSSDFKDNKKVIGFKFALQGIYQVIRAERNFRIHIVLTLIVISVGFIIQLSKLEWIIVILCIALVLVTEMINSSMELLIDYMFPDFHPVAGKVKDISAGAVLIAAICTSIIGVIIFLPKIINIF